MSSLMERILLDRFAPASVLVDERGDVVYVHGRTGAYLEPATGQARMNLFEMAREGLQPALSALLREAAEQRVAITRENVRVKSNGGYVHVNLSVSKLREPQNLRNLLLVTFRTVQAPARPPRRRKGGRASDEARLSDLERDLRETKESLRKTVEDLETSNEELKSANEELQSMNEELQSTNEELETSKEEMQSLNEELSTVNTELQDKVDELAHANDDMQNLMNSIEVGTIFLDNDLLIKRYTEAARKLINIISTDIGRPIADLKSNIKSDGIEDDAREVLRTLTRKEMDVESVTGHWYLMRILPYRTAENVIDGVVLTFVEIDRLKQAERREGEGKRFIATIGDAMENPYLVLDADLRIISANSAFQELFRLDAKRLIGERLDEIGEEEWNVPKLKQLLKNAAKGDAGFDDFQIERSFPKMGRRKIILRGRPLKEGGERGVVLLEVKHADGSPNV